MSQLLAIDWGTSSLRGALLDSDGTVLEERAFERGILTVAPGEFAAVFGSCFGDWMQSNYLCLMTGMNWLDERDPGAARYSQRAQAATKLVAVRNLSYISL